MRRSRGSSPTSFTRLRDGDRFYYQNAFKGAELREIQNTKLSDILKRNTDLENLQDNVSSSKLRSKGVCSEIGTGMETWAPASGHWGPDRRAARLDRGSLDDNHVEAQRDVPLRGDAAGDLHRSRGPAAGTTSTTVSTPIVLNKGMEVKGVLLASPRANGDS